LIHEKRIPDRGRGAKEDRVNSRQLTVNSRKEGKGKRINTENTEDAEITEKKL
jgi:hypothetical protein